MQSSKLVYHLCKGIFVEGNFINTSALNNTDAEITFKYNINTKKNKADLIFM